MFVDLPCVLALDQTIARNRIRQFAERQSRAEGNLRNYVHGRYEGVLFQAGDGTETVIAPKGKRIPDALLRVVQGAAPLDTATLDLSESVWLKHPVTIAAAGRPFDYPGEYQAVLDSWRGAFSYQEEADDPNVIALRRPQIGALHAINAHWTVSDEPATIVMPTGTGKTETMLSILVSSRCARVLVVVPTDALRAQIAEKFLSLGVLKDPRCAVLADHAMFPIVALLEHVPNDAREVDEVFGRSHVIVATSAIAGRCAPEIRDRMAGYCSHFFIDEAHHAEAPTWKSFKDGFRDRRIVQFTATPFREDGQPLDGKIIFEYPLRKAQQEDYFRPIRFRRVVKFDRSRADEAIATTAIEQLRDDWDKGHILMARTESVARANEVFKIYQRYPDFKPVALHTGIRPRERAEIRRQILAGEARIIVCVDMLGEGFDLPELKIAAFHDIRKTLAVTLQLAGRFTRSRPNLGEATFIANTADVQVQEELRSLYSRDPDWNLLLPELSERMIGEQVSLQDFLKGFEPTLNEIPLKSIRPALSTVVYKTKCANWSPESFRQGIPGIGKYEQVHVTVNHEERTLVAVMGRRSELSWGDAENLFNWTWDLYVVIWSPHQNLLFINCSGNTGEYRGLAEAIAGPDASLINGQDVFRSFAGVNRLRYQNIGLTEQLGRNVRYTGRMGGDVEPALDDIIKGRGSKTLLSGVGFEGGELVGIGASRKGRIWCHRRDRIDELAAWCRALGGKLLDETLNPDEVVKGTLTVKTLKERPPKRPIAIDWPEELYTEPESAWALVIDGTSYLPAQLAIELDAPAADGAIRFVIGSEVKQIAFALEIFVDGETPNYRIVPAGSGTAEIVQGSKLQVATDFFYQHPPTIWFADGSSLEGNRYVELRNAPPAYDVDKIQTLDWSGVNLKNESQGLEKDQSSIQARVIHELKKGDYALIFDDDRKGEAADVVTVRIVTEGAEPSGLEVEFYHCKYSLKHTPGHRIDDLYEVCGQAQKSIAWASSPLKKTDLFTHLLHREDLRRVAGEATRIDHGSEDVILTLRDMSWSGPRF